MPFCILDVTLGLWQIFKSHLFLNFFEFTSITRQWRPLVKLDGLLYISFLARLHFCHCGSIAVAASMFLPLRPSHSNPYNCHHRNHNMMITTAAKFPDAAAELSPPPEIHCLIIVPHNFCENILGGNNLFSPWMMVKRTTLHLVLHPPHWRNNANPDPAHSRPIII